MTMNVDYVDQKQELVQTFLEADQDAPESGFFAKAVDTVKHSEQKFLESLKNTTSLEEARILVDDTLGDVDHGETFLFKVRRVNEKLMDLENPE